MKHLPGQYLSGFLGGWTGANTMFPQTQGFDSHAAKHVGRVGALAVALGVGAAILGFPGVTAADGDTGTSAASG